MTNKELLQGVGYVDDALLDEALNVPKRRPAARWGAIAACAALVLLGGVLYGLSTRATEDIKTDTQRVEQAGMEQMAVPAPAPAEPTLQPERPSAPDLPAMPIPEIAPENGQANGTPAAPPQTDQSTEPAQEPPDPDNINTANAAMLPDQPVTENPEVLAPPPVTPMVDGYDGMYATACYAAPQDGTVGYSLPLWDAMDAYGDSVRYRVVIDVFSGEKPLDPDSEQVLAQRDRLAAAGYIVAWETVYQDEQPTNVYFTIHATLTQLQNFPADPDHGYFLMLYNERVPDHSGMNGLVTVYNGMIASTDAPGEPSVTEP